MQPSPIAETSKLLFPSLRFCIVLPARTAPHVSAAGEALELPASLNDEKVRLYFGRLPISLKFLPDPPGFQNCDSACSPSAAYATDSARGSWGELAGGLCGSKSAAVGRACVRQPLLRSSGLLPSGP